MLNSIKNYFPFFNKLSLAVIFLEYDRDKCGGSANVFNTLNIYLAQICGASITYIRVDNKNENEPLKNASRNIYTLGGDNRYREFSGWQKGFNYLSKLNRNFDLVLFVNDMFMAPGPSFLQGYADIDLLKRSLNENLIIGRIDSTGQQYSAYDYDVSQWICTNCFLAPKRAIEKIRDIVSVKDNLDDFLAPSFPDTLNNPAEETLALHVFKENAPINDTYKLWLVEWLTQRWHSRFEINEDTWDLFRTKVRNILNESLLTARLKEAGYLPQEYGEKRYY